MQNDKCLQLLYKYDDIKHLSYLWAHIIIFKTVTLLDAQIPSINRMKIDFPPSDITTDKHNSRIFHSSRLLSYLPVHAYLLLLKIKK